MARPAATAEAKVHPVPWVLTVSNLGAVNSRKLWPLKYRSVAGPSRCPPLTTTDAAPMATISRAAFFTSSSETIERPVRVSASGILGVTTAAMGNSRSRRAPTASSCRRESPLLATITGSTTNRRSSGIAEYFLSDLVTHSMIALLESIPVFTASAPMSVTTASICDSITLVGTSCTVVTASVFWAVMAVRTEVP